ncbi:two component transcriptional regulator, LuxR family [Chitinophaga sp. CF118]|uniref:response regulator transcription factor n=1 Tax=Chitinophaga sp. CF118 TaxID=1884367 RepID=UPI0008EC7CDB|nr:response regulator transcription factor [Chitinophaga sp. CF118]SFD26696.1 two component transcriptional regulator, LuxR family [Chitinophaga sp. CF118]
MNKITIGIVDDHTLFRQSLIALLQQESSLEILADAANGALFLEKIKDPKLLPEIALIDIDMPEMNGIVLNEQLQANYPQVKVIILSVHAQERLISTMIGAGAAAYLLKNCDKEEFTNAIHSVHKSGFYMSKDVFNALQNTKKNSKPIRNINAIPVELTNRETEILKLICGELSNTAIAEKLFLSIRTVEGHRNNLLLKTGCSNTAGLVLFAVKHGIYTLELM